MGKLKVSYRERAIQLLTFQNRITADMSCDALLQHNHTFSQTEAAHLQQQQHEVKYARSVTPGLAIKCFAVPADSISDRMSIQEDTPRRGSHIIFLDRDRMLGRSRKVK